MNESIDDQGKLVLVFDDDGELVGIYGYYLAKQVTRGYIREVLEDLRFTSR